MHKNATKYNETLNKWCKNKHGASKIMDMFETYHIQERRGELFKELPQSTCVKLSSRGPFI
jgi:hypothetical protein